MELPVRVLGVFARATREALESVVAPPVAATLLARAVAASGRDGVPEEVGAFRDFVEGPLRTELARVLGSAAVALVVERLGNVLWMATSDVRALDVARSWSRSGGRSAHDSGSRPKLAGREPGSDRPATPDPVSAKRPTIPAPPSSPPGSSPPSERLGSSPPPAHGLGALPPPPRLPGDARPDVVSGVQARARRSAPTLSAMSPALALPTCVLVITLDPALAAHTTEEIAGRCPVISIATPAELARVVTRAGDRVVVIVDTTLPSIELPTFVGLSPILPPGTRVVLWGADERQRARLVSRFPVARGWVPSGDSSTPGVLALSLPRA